ncbi:MAG: tetratricopeptide repeat protein [Gemmatimonadota bacterium]|nr:tetratricopeptide repeat protein [Gemmatimonadota bacterium]
MIRRGTLLVLTIALGGCALRSDVSRVERELATFQAEAARQDSIRGARLLEIVQLQQRILDSLENSSTAMRALRGDVANDLYNIQQQLVQLGELTGQSQQRLSELRSRLEAREEQIATVTDTTAPPAASADQIYEASLQQLRQGSTATARIGLRELLDTYPQHERVPDALYFIGESFASDSPDSAAAYYRQVTDRFASSPRAASAMYKLGLIAERRQDAAEARRAYQAVVEQYPQSDEAALARDRLQALGR